MYKNLFINVELFNKYNCLKLKILDLGTLIYFETLKLYQL